MLFYREFLDKNGVTAARYIPFPHPKQDSDMDCGIHVMQVSIIMLYFIIKSIQYDGDNI